MEETTYSENTATKINTRKRIFTEDLFRRVSDLIISLITLVILSPLLAVLAIIIRISGKGPVIYYQDRTGRNGKPFSIYKFRSMIYNAEKEEPQLSGDNTESVTRIGKFLRKYRIDEIPNFINVIKGEMSVVGYRPERQFFIDRIIKIAPEYLELQKIKPGITSWGQIKYGYASSIDEMIERLNFDLYYLKHRSIWFDLIIMIRTPVIILKGKGK